MTGDLRPTPIATGRPASGGVAALLLDLDGTLVDTDAAMAEAVVTSLTGIGAAFADGQAVAVAQAWVADRQGWLDRYQAGEMSFSEQRRLRFEEVATMAGADTGEFDEWEPRYVAALLAATRRFDDTLAFLDAVAGLPVAVVTNMTADVQQVKIDRAELTAHLPVVVGVDATGRPKPDPGMFHAACEQLGVEPAAALHVGDSWFADVTGALNAGVRAVWLDRLGLDAERRMPPRSRRVGGLAEVLPLLHAHAW